MTILIKELWSDPGQQLLCVCVASVEFLADFCGVGMFLLASYIAISDQKLIKKIC